MPNEETPRVSIAYGGFKPGELRRALWLILIAWFFGASFSGIVSGAAIISFLTKYLKTNDLQFALIMAAGPVAVAFQFLGSFVTERTGRTKVNFLIFVTLHRLLWIGVALVPICLMHATSTVQIWAVGIIIFLSAAIANYGGAGWPTWMSEIIPRSLAGRFFGIRSSLGMVAMVVIGTAVSYLLDRFDGQGWMYALVFAVAGIMGAVDILSFLPIRDLQRPPDTTGTPLLSLLVLPWKEVGFRNYLFYMFIAWISYNCMGPFVGRYCMDAVKNQGMAMNVSMTNIVLFVVPILAMAVFSPFWGRAVDKLGPRSVLAASSLMAVIVPLGWLFMRPGWFWQVVVLSIIGGITWPGVDQATVFMQIKGFPQQYNSVFNATFLVVSGIAGTVGIFIGGLLATFWQHNLHYLAPYLPVWVSHYHPVFATAIVVRLAALVFLFPRLRLPGQGRLAQVPGVVLDGLIDATPGIGDLVRIWRRRTQKMSA